jgi:hypothetical protein
LELPRKADYLALLETVDLLNTGCDGLLCVFKVEGRVPLGTCSDFNGTVFPIFMLEFQDYLDRVGLHLGLGQSYFGNLFYCFVGIETFLRLRISIVFDPFANGTCRLSLISFRIGKDDVLFLGVVKGDLLSISIHDSAFIYYMEAI